MTVVADTGPLNYLIRLGYIELLPQLHHRVIIPRAVHSELTHPKAPPEVRSWAYAPPPWLEVSTISALAENLSTELGPGEREALHPSLELRPDAILIDEILGRREAERLGLPLTGTLAILLELSLANGFDFPGSLHALRQSGFYLSTALETSIMAQHKRRQ